MPRENLKTSPAAAFPELFVGCAGWTIPAAFAEEFPTEGSHLQRYAQVFNAVEINSSFYRPHRPATYRRWADAVPEDFRFAVKMPRAISHEARLQACAPALQAFLDQAGPLGAKLGCLLLQLPPSLAFEASTALPFFDQLRRLYAGPVLCEPRHASWFAGSVSLALRERGIGRVAADPPRRPRAALPTGDMTLQYLRLHGSPRMYYDSYADAVLKGISRRMLRRTPGVLKCWCIFDNTAAGRATGNAMTLMTLNQADQGA